MLAVCGCVMTTLLLAACGASPESAPPAATVSSSGAVLQQATATATVPKATATSTRTAPTPTRTPRPAVTPTTIGTPEPAIGTEVATDGWRLTVTDYDTFYRVGDSTADGIYLYLRMTVVNTGSQPASFPFEGLVVTDVAGNTHFLDVDATRETLTYDFGLEIGELLQPGVATSVAAAFDIPLDATGLILTTPSRVFEVRIEYTDLSK